MLTGTPGDDIFALTVNIAQEGVVDGGAGFDIFDNRYGGSPGIFDLSTLELRNIEGIRSANYESYQIILTASQLSALQVIEGNFQISGPGTAVVTGGVTDLAGLVIKLAAAGNTLDISRYDTPFANVQGGAGNDIVFGNGGGGYIYGFGGSDELHGGGGADFILGGVGDDILYGDAGNDVLEGEDGNDIVYGGDGDDVILYSAASHFSVNDKIYGGDGFDVIRLKYIAPEMLDFTQLDMSGVEGIDTDFNSYFTKIRITTQQFNTLSAFHGRFQLTEGGTFSLAGKGTSFDGLFRGLVFDLAANTTFNAESFNHGISLNALSGQNVLTGTAYGDVLAGGTGVDALSGGGGSDHLTGNEGNDTLNGGAGNDYLYGGRGSDVVDGGEGDDVLAGDEGDDVIHGGGGNDQISGGSGSDGLYGEAGDDLIYYDPYDDAAKIQGGDGIDTLVFEQMGPPTGFDLAAHGFENALQRMTDLNNSESWNFIMTSYTVNWAISQQAIYYDNSSSFVLYDADNSQSYTRIINAQDQLGRTVNQLTVNDDGTSSSVVFDAAGTQSYTKIINAMNSAGQLQNQLTEYDDGTSVSIVYDAANVQAFDRIVNAQDAQGRTVNQLTSYDDGVEVSILFDAAGTQSYQQIINTLDAQKRLDAQEVRYDDGTHSFIDYDQDNSQAWARHVTEFGADGGILRDYFIL